MEWKNIVFEDVTHKCNACLERSTEHEWKKNMIYGEWIAGNEEIDPYLVRGFHISELYSPFSKWSGIIKKFKESKGDVQLMKVFTNTALGETWEEKFDKIDFIDLEKRRENYDCEIPERVSVLTAGVDVQDDRLEVEVVGWGTEEESWGIYYKVIMGSPAEQYVWNRLDEILDKEYSYKNGEKIKILCVCIDTGGHFTQEVYQYVKPREVKRVFGIKGRGGEGVSYLSKPRKTDRVGISLFTIGVNTGKETILSRLKIDIEGARYMHYPSNEERGYDETYFKGLTAEVKVTVFDKGVRKTVWKTVGTKRNEPLDIRNYAYAALKIANPNLNKKYGYEVTQSKPVIRKRRTISKGI